MSILLPHPVDGVPVDNAVTSEGLEISLDACNLWLDSQPSFHPSLSSSHGPHKNGVQLSITLKGSFISHTLKPPQSLDANTLTDLQIHLFRDDLSDKFVWDRPSLELVPLDTGLMVSAREGPAWREESPVKYFVVVSLGGVRLRSKVFQLQRVY